ncbi:hypothetical protein BGZ94_001545 [Podila epigama]|nr:hypothetical protein BGZ94_001545 [Podila epigama]
MWDAKHSRPAASSSADNSELDDNYSFTDSELVSHPSDSEYLARLQSQSPSSQASTRHSSARSSFDSPSLPARPFSSSSPIGKSDDGFLFVSTSEIDAISRPHSAMSQHSDIDQNSMSFIYPSMLLSSHHTTMHAINKNDNNLQESEPISCQALPHLDGSQGFVAGSPYSSPYLDSSMETLRGTLYNKSEPTVKPLLVPSRVHSLKVLGDTEVEGDLVHQNLGDTEVEGQVHAGAAPEANRHDVPTDNPLEAAHTLFNPVCNPNGVENVSQVGIIQGTNPTPEAIIKENLASSIHAVPTATQALPTTSSVEMAQSPRKTRRSVVSKKPVIAKVRQDPPKEAKEAATSNGSQASTLARSLIILLSAFFCSMAGMVMMAHTSVSNITPQSIAYLLGLGFKATSPAHAVLHQVFYKDDYRLAVVTIDLFTADGRPFENRKTHKSDVLQARMLESSKPMHLDTAPDSSSTFTEPMVLSFVNGSYGVFITSRRPLALQPGLPPGTSPWVCHRTPQYMHLWFANGTHVPGTPTEIFTSSSTVPPPACLSKMQHNPDNVFREDSSDEFYYTLKNSGWHVTDYMFAWIDHSWNRLALVSEYHREQIQLALNLAIQHLQYVSKRIHEWMASVSNTWQNHVPTSSSGFHEQAIQGLQRARKNAKKIQGRVIKKLTDVYEHSTHKSTTWATAFNKSAARQRLKKMTDKLVS